MAQDGWKSRRNDRHEHGEAERRRFQELAGIWFVLDIRLEPLFRTTKYLIGARAEAQFFVTHDWGISPDVV
jgi:hypothetical protein